MAPKGRREESSTNGHGKGTFRFRYMDSNRQFEVQADNVNGENLLEGFRHVANAITGRTITAPKQLKTPGAPTEVLDDKDEEIITTADLPFDSQPAAVVEREEEEETEQEESSPSIKRPRPAPKAPKFLKELDLTKATISLQDFMEKKKPDTDIEKYAVIGVWLKDQFNIEEVGIDHVYTAYSALDWLTQMPPDPAQTFRNMKSQKNWCDTGSSKGLFKMNWKGIDAVNKMGVAKP